MTLVAATFAVFAVVAVVLYRREHRRRVVAQLCLDALVQAMDAIGIRTICACPACVAERKRKEALPS